MKVVLTRQPARILEIEISPGVEIRREVKPLSLNLLDAATNGMTALSKKLKDKKITERDYIIECVKMVFVDQDVSWCYDLEIDYVNEILAAASEIQRKGRELPKEEKKTASRRNTKR